MLTAISARHKQYLPHLLLIALIAIYLGSVAVVAEQGARPFVDEWIYIDAAHRFAESTEIHVAPISYAFAIFEAVYGGIALSLLGGSVKTLIMASAVLSSGAAIALWDLLVRSRVHPSMAVAVVGAFLFGPVFFALSSSYMTDTHAVNLAIISAAMYSRGIDGSKAGAHHAWIVAGSVAAALAYFSRPAGVAVIAGAAFVAYRSRRWLDLILVVAVPTLAVVFHLGGQQLGTFPGLRVDIADRLSIPPLSSISELLIVAVISTGIWLIPILPSVMKAISDTWKAAHIGLAVIAITAILLVVLDWSGGLPASGNWLGRSGMFPIDESTTGDRIPLIGWSTHLVTVILAVQLAVLFLVSIARSGTPPYRLPAAEAGLWAFASSALLLVSITQVASFGLALDRYVLVLLPVVLYAGAVRALRNTSARHRYFTAVTLGAVALLTLCLAVDGMRVQQAVFLTAESATSQGIETDDLDGGAAWTGFRFGLDMQPRDIVSSQEKHWWRGRFAPGIDPRYVVALNPPTGECTTHVVEVEALLGANNRVGLMDSVCPAG